MPGRHNLRKKRNASNIENIENKIIRINKGPPIINPNKKPKQDPPNPILNDLDFLTN